MSPRERRAARAQAARRTPVAQLRAYRGFYRWLAQRETEPARRRRALGLVEYYSARIRAELRLAGGGS